MAEAVSSYNDTLSSHGEGKVYITINGSNREAFELSKFTAELKATVSSKRMLGHRMTQHKITGMEGSGSATFYFMNSQQLVSAQTYVNSGSFTGFTMMVINEDPKSTVGEQEVALYNVTPATFPVAYLDDGSDDGMSYDTDITFDSMQILSKFSLPTNYR